jgi:serine/alanine adding enzyme
VVEIDFRTDGRWNAFVGAHPGGLVYHHSAWLEALSAETGRSPFGLAVEDEDGRLHGVLPLCETRGLPLLGSAESGPRLSSLPRTPVAGPLGDDDQEVAALLEAAADRARASARSLQIKTLDRSLDGLADGLEATPWRSSYALRLQSDPDRIRFGDARNHGAVMRAIRKAERSGVRVREAESEADLRAWYRLYLVTMRSVVVPPRSFRLFSAIWERMRPLGLSRLLLAERQERGRHLLLAGSLSLQLGSRVFYAFNGRAAEHLEFRPNEAIHWAAIRDACRQGYKWYDFGEAETGSSLAAFKQKWADDVGVLYRYYLHPAPGTSGGDDRRSRGARVAEGLWRRLPLRATEALGRRIYRFL